MRDKGVVWGAGFVAAAVGSVLLFRALSAVPDPDPSWWRDKEMREAFPARPQKVVPAADRRPAEKPTPLPPVLAPPLAERPIDPAVPEPVPSSAPPKKGVPAPRTEMLNAALGAGRFPDRFVQAMEVVPVRHLGFDGEIHDGEIVVHEDLAEEVRAIFDEILEAREPIEKIVPIVAYDWDDQASMDDNNTSGFNYRRTIGPGLGKKLSNHAYGRAIDINPVQNPYLDRRGKGDYPYEPTARGAITRDSAITRAFRKRGWQWGGAWRGAKDYQHFEKPGGL